MVISLTHDNILYYVINDNWSIEAVLNELILTLITIKTAIELKALLNQKDI